LDRLSIRLDASAYCTADKAALGDAPTILLSELADVRQPTIFGKKEMQGTPSRGMPLFSSSEMLLQSPQPAYFISRRFESRLRQLLGVTEGTILVLLTALSRRRLKPSSWKIFWCLGSPPTQPPKSRPTSTVLTVSAARRPLSTTPQLRRFFNATTFRLWSSKVRDRLSTAAL
jgi:hypothetical protein